MTTGQNKELADRFHLQIFQEGRLELAPELLTESFSWHGGFAPPERGPEAVKAVATAVIGAFPDRKITHHEVIAEDDKVLIRWSMSGTHKGELMGLPPTDKWMTITGLDLFRLDGARIAELWQEADQLGMLRQLGVVPEAEQPG